MLFKGIISFDIKARMQYCRSPLIRINWDGETSGYAKNPDN
jgi:hypothetical protein